MCVRSPNPHFWAEMTVLASFSRFSGPWSLFGPFWPFSPALAGLHRYAPQEADMPLGGHSRSGPPPDPNALRRARKSDKVTFTTLPERREGPPPPWPLSRPSARERAVWAREWTRPQAHMWELLGLEVEVAFYVRTMVRAEQPDGAVTLLSTLSRQQDSLGLTVPGMARNRWVIQTDDARSTAQPAEAAAEATSSSARDRLRLLGTG